MQFTRKPIYDYASIKIDADRQKFLQVSNLKFPTQAGGKMIPHGIGNPYLSMSSRGYARGRFEGTFEMDMHLHDWMEFKTKYRDKHNGVFTPEGIVFTVSYADERGKVRIQYVLYVILMDSEVFNMDDEGGKSIMVHVKGNLMKEPDEYFDGVLVETRSFAQSLGIA
ncbi:hypothetical protein [Borrelia sp. RT1S]|uniref:hypothetical protein n=1 Tax=Borrelia sp. RT1S TaxID=2898580 RepID=UPI001E5FD59A|nr:hypothetical protein [Borrelia sp. RT1S]UGQ17877.1 hypothetical protein LSO05_05445 [Borrelia sp. RT1S]